MSKWSNIADAMINFAISVGDWWSESQRRSAEQRKREQEYRAKKNQEKKERLARGELTVWEEMERQNNKKLAESLNKILFWVVLLGGLWIWGKLKN